MLLQMHGYVLQTKGGAFDIAGFGLIMFDVWANCNVLLRFGLVVLRLLRLLSFWMVTMGTCMIMCSLCVCKNIYMCHPVRVRHS